MDFLGIIQEVNKDCGLSKNIKLSRFTESTDVGEKDVGKKDVGKKDTNRWYKSLEESIIYNLDPMISILPNEDTYFYYNQLIMKICSEIDENTSEKYDNFNYIKRIMGKHKIQQGLQMKNTLSSLLYLSDYYQTHFVILKDNNYYETSVRSKYNKKYLCINNTSYQVRDEIELSDYSKKYYFEDTFEIENNIGIDSFTIYQTDMKAISNYKLAELIEIANNCKLQITTAGKNKKKKDLYAEIIIHKMQ